MRPATPAPEYNRPGTASSVGTKSRTAPAAVALSTVASFRFGRHEHGGYVPEHQQGRRDQDRQADLQPTPSIAQCRAPGERGGRAEHSTAQHSTAQHSQGRIPAASSLPARRRPSRHPPEHRGQRARPLPTPPATAASSSGCPRVPTPGRRTTTASRQCGQAPNDCPPTTTSHRRRSRRGPSGAHRDHPRVRITRPRQTPQGHRGSIRLPVRGCCPVAAGPVEAG